MLENGRADVAYQKFTPPKVRSMILRISKAGQTIIPSVLNEILKGLYDEPTYNFSFSLYASPYGDLYNKAIKRKLKSNAGSSLFIVTVDPWSISGPLGTPNDPSTFEENSLYLRDAWLVDVNPNLFYLYKHYVKSFYEILIQRLKPGKTKIHLDGWWETEDFVDKNIVSARTNHLVRSYTEYSEMHQFSSLRLKSLQDLLAYLKERGDVLVVRLPLHPVIFKIENDAIPDFNKIVSQLCDKTGVIYQDLNFLASELFFEDGLHLDKESSRKLSVYIAELVNEKFNPSNSNSN